MGKTINIESLVQKILNTIGKTEIPEYINGFKPWIVVSVKFPRFLADKIDITAKRLGFETKSHMIRALLCGAMYLAGVLEDEDEYIICLGAVRNRDPRKLVERILRELEDLVEIAYRGLAHDICALAELACGDGGDGNTVVVRKALESI